MKYKRVLLKLSGGALTGKNGDSFGVENLEHITDEIISLTSMGMEVCIVIGGGNIFRGNLSTQWGIDRDIESGFGQRKRRRAPDPARRTRNQRHLSFVPHSLSW